MDVKEETGADASRNALQTVSLIVYPQQMHKADAATRLLYEENR
jgi:hypothetical protein